MLSFEGSGPGGVRSGWEQGAKWKQGGTNVWVCVCLPVKHPGSLLFNQSIPGTLVGFVENLGHVVGCAATRERKISLCETVSFLSFLFAPYCRFGQGGGNA